MAQTRMNTWPALEPAQWLALWRDAWAQLLPWPALRRCMPRTRVQVLGADQQVAFVRDAHWQPAPPGTPPGTARAVLLPPGQVLWRRLRLPAATPRKALQAAAALEVQTMSPFAAEETLWAWTTRATAQPAWHQLDICITARHLAQQALERSAPGHQAQNRAQKAARAAAQDVEVWAAAPDSASAPVLLPGFGEAQRLGREARQRWQLLGGVLLMLTLLAALALTPSLQLRERARDAAQQFEQLGQDSREAMAQRQALVDQAEGLAGLLQRQRQQIDPVRVMATLTDLLPDHTAVQMIHLRGLTLTVQGLSDNASEIVNLLARSPGFGNVSLPSAVTREPRSNKDRFTLQAEIDPAVFGKHPAQTP